MSFPELQMELLQYTCSGRVCSLPVCALVLFTAVQSLGTFSSCDLICLHSSLPVILPYNSGPSLFFVWDHFQNKAKQKTNNADSGPIVNVSDVD